LLLQDSTGAVRILHEGGESGVAEIWTPEGSELVYQTFDFPGWQVKVDGQVTSHRRSGPLGLIAIDLPPGRHTVEVRMGTTPARTAGTVASGIGLAIVLVLLAWRPVRRREP
jgi:hypothetical protein